ncbi:hypothetical protein [Microbacterium sp. KSW4-4]|uniref:hypothetical protein n=1 Tax=Microbacterium sp. KSW4-4 TaxID=2851651 RepID=UPI001FFC8C62|nr:hypothetical protein [Microbacterium sp. KSW4-4]MCK2033472.1 hypothetical protein [Microbacterium sp. KSW4-4]
METTSEVTHETDGDALSGTAPETDELERAERRRLAVNSFGWIAAWGVSVVALIVGISLTGVGTVKHIVEYSDSYDVFTREVWPAGLVLLGVGALGIIATALATAVLPQKR